MSRVEKLEEMLENMVNALEHQLMDNPPEGGLFELREGIAKARALLAEGIVCQFDGEPCPAHSDVVHGAEAEELRSGVQTLISRKHYAVSHLENALEDLLDRIDARDSLAFLEASKKKQVAEQPKKSCRACSHSGMGPDDDYPYCGHPDTGFWGVSLRTEPAAHCPNHSKFEQHPLRLPSGHLKKT